MKKKLKNILIGIFICCSIYGIFNLTTNYFNVKADSGWDSSYDSGSSSSGSSWSGGSSSNISDAEMWFWLIFIVILFFSFVAKYSTDKNRQSGFENHDYEEISDDIIAKIDSNFVREEFKLNVFNIYKDIQIAWMDFDTDTIRELTTDEIYNMYSAQLESLKLKNQKNIMKDITLEDVRIIDIKKENEIITLEVYLNVKCYDYVINESTKETIRGNDSKKLNIEYVLSFVRTSDNFDGVKCPGCGAEIEMNASAICPYCRSTLVKTSDKYVMSKKTCVGQSLDE